LFALGASGAFSVNLIGALPGGEILTLVLLPVLLLSRGRIAFRRQYLWFYLLTVGWLLGTIIADQANGTDWFNQSKGLARVIFFLMDFMILAILINNEARKLIVLAFGMAAVMSLSAAQYKDIAIIIKFGGASAAIIVLLLASSYYYSKRKYRICFGIAVALAVLNLAFAFRSQVAIIVASSVLILPFGNGKSRVGKGDSSGERSTLRIILLLAFAGVCVFLANEAIKYVATLGFYEESTQEKFQTQSHGKLGVLFGGRPETLVAIQAIRDSPIIGHGSFAADIRYIELKQELQYKYGYSDSDTPEEVDYPAIPTHSHLTMAWVESGILGGVLWIYIFGLTARALLAMAKKPHDLAPLYSYFLVNFLWDILYSPFGSINRMLGAYFVLMSYQVLQSGTPDLRRVGVRQRKVVNMRRIVHQRLPTPG
jgi:O-antigen ligase